MIRGGTARNILARECLIDWEFRGLPNQSSALALAKVERFVDEVALPRLRRFTAKPTIETVMDVDVPGLAAEGDSAAARLAMRSCAREPHDRRLLRHRGRPFSARAAPHRRLRPWFDR